MEYLLEIVDYLSKLLVGGGFTGLEQRSEVIVHDKIIMDRFEEILKQGKLLFTPKQYPKYLRNKLRVFQPSTLIRISLATATLYALLKLYDAVNPREIVIEYPVEQQ